MYPTRFRYPHHVPPHATSPEPPKELARSFLGVFRYSGRALELVWSTSHALTVALAALTLILGAAYTLWLVKRTIFGAVANHHVAEMKDIDGREFLVLALLALAVLLLGVWPAPLLDTMRGTIEQLTTQILATKL